MSCLNMPHPVLTFEQAVECKNKCKENQDKFCCGYECYVKTSEIFVDGKFQKEALNKAYEISFEQMNSTDMKEAWVPVLKKSLETCEKLSKSFNLNDYLLRYSFLPLKIVTKSKDIALCSAVPAEHIAISFCVHQMNFLNCPSEFFNATKKCEDVKAFIQADNGCGHKYEETFIIDWTFWIN